METFRSVFDIKTQAKPISYADSIMAIGSCFSVEMGSKMALTGFDIDVNPFGITFHPCAINRSLMRILENRPYSESELIEVYNGFASWDHHGSFNSLEKERVLSDINGRLNRAFDQISKANLIILTWGSAWGYWLRETNRLVNNCHKQSSGLFEKRLMPIIPLVEETIETIFAIRKANPTVEIEISVSPVRHLRDGMPENNLSKSHLIAAAHAVCHELQGVSYFPSYELVIDDLRDYRFFKQDKMHPTEEAVQYVWNRYQSARMEPLTLEANRKIEKIASIFMHRPGNKMLHDQQVAAAGQSINQILATFKN